MDPALLLDFWKSMIHEMIIKQYWLLFSNIFIFILNKNRMIEIDPKVRVTSEDFYEDFWQFALLTIY